jgi:hypothetical protein
MMQGIHDGLLIVLNARSSLTGYGGGSKKKSLVLGMKWNRVLRLFEEHLSSWEACSIGLGTHKGSKGPHGLYLASHRTTGRVCFLQAGFTIAGSKTFAIVGL